ncbi:Transcriptional regulator, putative [Shewanella piezotolerans WP3]|uniref:Redox-sensitive transcriptional activator SoxR n=1 Tax=Shewanella piezotolerans (strain WP3 / JCM 13877) TaxID=225849 RepID=B8CNT3_SHEPW|nr:redox-sensitive transcriptional activator SoxR [Shewanella piezotolerans]ACJ29052.1 Transcriptional regulator, putative [Shewanella piezotolerans WP3]
MPNSDMSVGEVSKRTGVAISALHFYETRGLIKSTRNTGNHRRYSRTVLRKISVIKAAQQAGISLTEIAEQLAAIPNNDKVTSTAWETLSSSWKVSLDEKIERLTLLRDTLSYCIGCGCLSEKYCSLINPDDQLASKGTGARLLDPKEADTIREIKARYAAEQD